MIHGESPLIHLSTDFIRAKEYFEAIVSSSPDAICTTDIAGRIIYFSPGAETMLEIKSESVIGRYAYEFYAEGKIEAVKIMRELCPKGQIRNREILLKGKNGKTIHASLAASILRNQRGETIGILGIFKDISDRVRLERRLEELCRTDPLTGLYNRRHFEDMLAQEMRRARRQGYPLSVILIDLDGFKKINDGYGHKAGDRSLKSFSALLRESIRQGVDSAFRFGGDEFTALLPGLSSSGAKRVVQRIIRALDARSSRGKIVFSYGIAGFPSYNNPARLIQEADLRMYRMKKIHSRPA